MCKGADSVIIPRLKEDETNERLKDQTNKYLEGYAKQGLRTLILCQKVISEDEY